MSAGAPITDPFISRPVLARALSLSRATLLRWERPEANKFTAHLAPKLPPGILLASNHTGWYLSMLPDWAQRPFIGPDCKVDESKLCVAERQRPKVRPMAAAMEDPLS